MFTKRINRTEGTALTHASVARFYLLLGLLLCYVGYEVLQLPATTYGDTFYWPGVGLLLASFMLLNFYAMEKFILIVNYVGRNLTMEYQDYDEYSTTMRICRTM